MMYYKLNRISNILGHISGEGITVFHHDKTMETQIIPYCETEDCFKSELKYTRPMELIELVVDNSQHCEQMLDVSFLQYHVLFKSLSLLKMMCDVVSLLLFATVTIWLMVQQEWRSPNILFWQ